MRCNRCYRKMKGTTAYDGACACGGLIEADSSVVKIQCHTLISQLNVKESNHGPI